MLMHPSPPVSAPQSHWGHPAKSKVTTCLHSVSPPDAASTAQHFSHSPNPPLALVSNTS